MSVCAMLVTFALLANRAATAGVVFAGVALVR